MCGRTACTLAPDQISTACSYKDVNGIKRNPKWAKISAKQDSYKPSPNIGPKTFTPVLVSPKRFSKEVEPEENEDRILCEMQWGLIPSWHKGTEDSFKFNMINCRSDTLLEKSSFKGPLERGQRCVVLAEGFYEWQTNKSGRKQPYFLQFGKKESANSDDDSDKEGKCLVKMAALYDKWYSPESRDPLYSYTIITVAACEPLKWLHDRMPAILETDEDVCQWLDHGSVPALKAFQSLIKPVTSLSWFPVSTLVNSVKNKSPECLKKIELDAGGNETKKSASSKLMSAWVKRSPRKHGDRKDDVKIEEKKPKLG